MKQPKLNVPEFFKELVQRAARIHALNREQEPVAMGSIVKSPPNLIAAERIRETAQPAIQTRAVTSRADLAVVVKVRYVVQNSVFLHSAVALDVALDFAADTFAAILTTVALTRLAVAAVLSLKHFAVME